MAIQMRRGLKAEFDPGKMLPGEWAVAIDDDTQNQIVWMCFRTGVVKRMGTYEDFLEQIREATGDIRDEYVKEFNELIKEVGADVVIEIRDEITQEYLPQIQAYVTQAGVSRDSAAQSAADSQVYSSTAQHYYELTRTLSIANVGDITFSIDAERNCMVATFMDDSGEEPHDWYTRFLAFLEEYANDVKTQLSNAEKQATAAAGSAAAAAKSLTDSQTVKTQCDNVLEETQGVKTAAEESLEEIKAAAEKSCGDIRDETIVIKNAAATAEANSRTAATQSAAARDDANAAADLAEQYAQETRQLSISNVGEIQFSINAERKCLTASYEE